MALQKKTESWKLKKWYSVYAPKVFKEAIIGEMPANEDKNVLGRNIVVGLDSLTKNPSNAYTSVTLKVTDVNGNAAHTKLVSMSQLYSYIRSLVRRYRSVASTVLPVKSKDGVAMVIKMLVITRQRSTHSRIMGIRKEMNVHILNYFSENNFDAAMAAIIEGRFQAELAAKLKHITPLNKVEVRMIQIK
jgi:small subunit ribosomal protein S3Ae